MLAGLSITEPVTSSKGFVVGAQKSRFNQAFPTGPRLTRTKTINEFPELRSHITYHTVMRQRATINGRYILHNLSSRIFEEPVRCGRVARWE